MKASTPDDGAGKRAPAKDVDAYLAMVPPDVRDVLENLRKTIRAAAPMAEEVISYRMPAYKYHGPLVFFAAFKNHCSLFVPGIPLLEAFGTELEPYHTSGATIHFTVARPLPAALVKRIVEARIAENEARAKRR